MKSATQMWHAPELRRREIMWAMTAFLLQSLPLILSHPPCESLMVAEENFVSPRPRPTHWSLTATQSLFPSPALS